MPARRRSRWQAMDRTEALPGSSAFSGCTPASWNTSRTFRLAGTRHLWISRHRPLELCAAGWPCSSCGVAARLCRAGVMPRSRRWPPAARRVRAAKCAGAIGIGGAASQIGDPGRIFGRVHREKGRTGRRQSVISSAREALRVNGDLGMRVLELALAGVLALAAPIATHAAPPGSNIGAAGRGPLLDFMHVGNTHGAQWLSAPGGGGGGWHPPHWGPSRLSGGWGPYGGPGVPTYWVWGPSGGAFDYPFSDWRGPSGGWGNP
jgi:hypothetical protein